MINLLRYTVRVSFIILLPGFIYSGIYAQKKFSARFFEGTTWAASDKDSSFFNSDTVRIIQIQGKSYSANEGSKDVAGYFGNSDFITIVLNKTNALSLFTTKVNAWSIIKKKGTYRWAFIYRGQMLKLYFNNKLIASFDLLSESKAQIKSSYEGRPPTITTELLMVRVR
jgi:hypothetical protein